MNDYQDAELRETVSAELYPGEKLLWVGKPSPLRVVIQNLRDENLTSIVLILLIFSGFLLASGFLGAGRFAQGIIYLVVIVLFVISLALLLISSSYTYWRAGQIVYGISNQRALIIRQTIDGKNVLAYNIMPYIERRGRANGKGDLIFASKTVGAGNRSYRSSFNRNFYLRTREIGFFGIDNVREVEQLLFKTFVKKEPTIQ
ncbi:MAG: hypothetical protein ABI700_15980 [Chloroflexota bacterium]